MDIHNVTDCDFKYKDLHCSLDFIVCFESGRCVLRIMDIVFYFNVIDCDF